MCGQYILCLDNPGQQFLEADRHMNITWYGHSCFKLECGPSTILIDPFLSGSPTYQGTVEDAARGVTHVALTHGHDDHVGDSVEICRATGATLIAVFELATHLNAQGVENVDPTNTGGTVSHDGFRLTFTPARHSSSTTVDGNNIYLGNPCGLVVTPDDGPVTYHMGDTDIMGDMALTEELHHPEIGIVPIGDRFTMGARSAAHACKKYFNFKTIIPCHYGTFPIIDPDASAFVKEMDGHNVVVPEIGGSLSV